MFQYDFKSVESSAWEFQMPNISVTSNNLVIGLDDDSLYLRSKASDILRDTSSAATLSACGRLDSNNLPIGKDSVAIYRIPFTTWSRINYKSAVKEGLGSKK